MDLLGITTMSFKEHLKQRKLSMKGTEKVLSVNNYWIV
jgi:hypothetical protein